VLIYARDTETDTEPVTETETKTETETCDVGNKRGSTIAPTKLGLSRLRHFAPIATLRAVLSIDPLSDVAAVVTGR
jgi:hypothetical protein